VKCVLVCSVIEEDDLLRFMYEEETKKALTQFDGGTEKKCITKQALKKWVVRFYLLPRVAQLRVRPGAVSVVELCSPLQWSSNVCISERKFKS
jgi:hypothetical protein